MPRSRWASLGAGWRRGRRAVVRWWHNLRHPPLSRRGERAAERYLSGQGLTIVARGWRSRTGELDLVAVDGRTVVFVEVKTRTSLDAGHPAESVTPEKQRQLAREALAFVRRHRLGEYPLRFDVVAVLWPPPARTPRIEHFPSAFEPPGRGQLWA